MNNRSSLLTAAISLLLFAFCAVPAVGAAAISLHEYRQQLHDLSEQVNYLADHTGQAGQIIKAIPDQVTVSTAAGETTVTYHHLKDDLTQFSTASDKLKTAQLKKIQSYLEQLSIEAQKYEQGAADPASSRQRLSQILARHEFKRVHRPGLKETVLGKFYRWLSGLLSRLHFGSRAGTNFLESVVYTLVGLALLILVFWTVRRLRRPEEDTPPREIFPFAPSARSWRAWLAEAREFAEKQDWRNAIHLAYWAGISFLESGGAWKPNRARTPREYLRLLSSRNPNYSTLSALTKKFEFVWYGHRTAAEPDFQETLSQLEKLGCR